MVRGPGTDAKSKMTDFAHTSPQGGGLATLIPAGRGRWAVRACFSALLAGLAVYGTYLLFNDGGGVHIAFDHVLYCTLMLGAALLVLARAVAVERERWAWTFIGLDLLALGIAELLMAVFYANDPNAPYPSIADAFFLASYPFLYVGLALLLRDRVSRFQPAMWLDGAVAALTVGALATTFVFPEIVASGEGSFLPDATTFAYPAGDTLALAFMIALLVLVGTHAGLSLILILAALAVLPVADGVYSYQVATDSYVEGGLIDFLWPLGSVLLAITAWMQPHRETAVPARGWRSIATPAFFALLAGGLLIYGYVGGLETVAVGLAGAALLLSVARLALTYRDNQSLFEQAQTDSLTHLGNRSALMLDLEEVFPENGQAEERVLVMLDLNGFKLYNDTFGHPAGDRLLSRLGRRFADAVGPRGRAYRIGGDEFCGLLACPPEEVGARISRIGAAMRETGEGFDVSAASGNVALPREAANAQSALQIADRRMYLDKAGSRSSARSQAHEVLMRTLRERQPELGVHVDRVAELSSAVARRMGIDGDELDMIKRAAELHDIGKMAIPDAVLNKPSELDPDEWKFIRDHTLIGERILREAPALATVADLVRSSHERWDGDGYPDGLEAEEIPLGSRIIIACDAFHAMTMDRPYAAALSFEAAIEELRRCSGTQFDPKVIEQLCAELSTDPLLREVSSVATAREAD